RAPAQTRTHALSPDQCVANAQIQRAASAEDDYVISPGDQLDIDFYLSPEFNQSVAVRPDGRISLRMIGDLRAAGLTPTALSDEIDKSYQQELRSPDAAVHVKNMPSRKIYVQGEVNRPGGFPLDSGMTALQAISRAGGVTNDANEVAVLIR